MWCKECALGKRLHKAVSGFVETSSGGKKLHEVKFYQLHAINISSSYNKGNFRLLLKRLFWVVKKL